MHGAAVSSRGPRWTANSRRIRPRSGARRARKFGRVLWRRGLYPLELGPPCIHRAWLPGGGGPLVAFLYRPCGPDLGYGRVLERRRRRKRYLYEPGLHARDAVLVVRAKVRIPVVHVRPLRTDWRESHGQADELSRLGGAGGPLGFGGLVELPYAVHPAVIVGRGFEDADRKRPVVMEQ